MPTAVEQPVDPRYPIGKFQWKGSLTPEERNDLLDSLAGAPAHLRNAVEGLTEAQLDTPYREGGWTIRQVIHHVPDSHMNSYVRCRMALTEDNPVVKPYAEDLWAELPDAKGPLTETSLCLLECLHTRWVTLLRTLTDEQWKRTMNHPVNGLMSLEKTLALYAWHTSHHVAHITGLRERMGW